MKFIDLFAGIGGFRTGFERAGFECVFTSEIDSACQEVYEQNFGEKPFGDITKIEPEFLPDFDILLAGFPCQPFSISGRKLGFEDTRGTLFFNICQIIEQKQPSVVVLENVKHLIHHDKKRTFKVIIESLKNLGYKVSYKILNAKDFGVPQNRERIFIIASKYKIFDFSKLRKKTTPKLRDFLDNEGDFEILDKSEYTLIEQIREQETGLLFAGYRNKGTWRKGVRPNTEHLSRVHRQPNRIYSIDGVHPTIPSQETSGRFFIYIPEQDIVRKLTINECYRLMGFPENFKKHRRLSENYRQVGNSVAIPVIEEIAKSILKQNLLIDEPQTEIVGNLQMLLFS
ncbi:MAG: DNA (cytosine-5-)-methyltransferase [Spirosomaceae bacterium]|jgi:DNA (cytosine-5)-methyltransferase 1|nr:DNA (cytosine-5-)-methyltransferase [Spirosomataceae bacterium]